MLIIGLGDPVRGARVPDPLEDEQWMRHNGVEVVSRLQESTLQQLADRGANVTYFPARTRPFDLVPLYQQLIAGSHDDTVVGGLRQVRYSEGYPYLLVLSVALWLSTTPRPGLIRRRSALASSALLVTLCLLFTGCADRVEGDAAAYQARFDQGRELLKFAQEQADRDPFAEHSLLLDAREQFLHAALLQPGSLDAARQITFITQRLHALEGEMRRQRAEEDQRREKLVDTIARLEAITHQQDQIGQRSRRMMRRRTPLSEADYNLPEPIAPSESFPSPEELADVAPSFATQQQTVRQATVGVLDSLTLQRDTLRDVLKRAYGGVENLPPTELDPIVDLLTSAVNEQQRALACLDPEAIEWPQANTAFHTATGRMQQALDALRTLQPPEPEQDEDSPPPPAANDLDDIAGPDTNVQDGAARPMQPSDFQEALSLQSLPIPNYTSAEILAEEAANQQKRARRKAAGAAARVEKNW